MQLFLAYCISQWMVIPCSSEAKVVYLIRTNENIIRSENEHPLPKCYWNFRTMVNMFVNSFNCSLGRLIDVWNYTAEWFFLSFSLAILLTEVWSDHFQMFQKGFWVFPYIKSLSLIIQRSSLTYPCRLHLFKERVLLNVVFKVEEHCHVVINTFTDHSYRINVTRWCAFSHIFSATFCFLTVNLICPRAAQLPVFDRFFSSTFLTSVLPSQNSFVYIYFFFLIIIYTNLLINKLITGRFPIVPFHPNWLDFWSCIYT